MLKVSSREYDIDKLITERIGMIYKQKVVDVLKINFLEDSMLYGINKRLHKLDNGGYHLIYNEPFVLLR